MSDPYATIDQADEALQLRLANILELRAAEPRKRANRPTCSRSWTGAPTCWSRQAPWAPSKPMRSSEARRRVAEGEFFGHISQGPRAPALSRLESCAALRDRAP
jgi:hypothetical protein